MTSFLEFFSVLIASSLVVAVFLFFPKREEQNFVKLSMFFIALFYLVPAIMFLFSDNLQYGNRYLREATSGVFFAMLCLLVFLAGFMLKDVRGVRVRKGATLSQKPAEKAASSLSINKRRVMIIFVLGVALSIFVRLAAPSNELLYEIRRGEVGGSHIFALLSIVSSALLFSAFFLCIRANWRLLAGVCIALVFASYIYGSPGRATLGMAILLLAIFLFRISPRLIVFALPIALLIFLPAIINGKSIIYRTVVLRELPSFAQFFDYSVVNVYSIFGNVAHPFVSTVFVYDLIDNIGVRFFFDYLQGFLFYFKVIGMDFGVSLTYYNTEVFTGTIESIVPTGYITFGYVQGLFLGVFFAGIFYRHTFSFLRRTAMYRVARSQELNFYFSFLAAGTFYSGEIRTLVLGFFLPALIFHLSGWLCTKRSNGAVKLGSSA